MVRRIQDPDGRGVDHLSQRGHIETDKTSGEVSSVVVGKGSEDTSV